MIDYYVELLKDSYRIETFREAIREVVQPGDVVVEVGAGLGTFSFFAAQAGAEKVFAIEKGAVRHLLPSLIADNRFQERIEVIPKAAHQVKLESRADVLITEDFSHLFLDSALQELLLWPRRSLLREGGKIIPESVSVYFAPVECPRASVRHDPWQDPAFGYGLELERAREMAANLTYDETLRPEQLLAEPQLHTRLETSTFDSQSFHSRLRFRMQRKGNLGGLAGWFEANLSPNLVLSNAPGTRSRVWQQGVLMVPVAEVQAGDELEVDISLLRDPWLNTFWEWKGRLKTGAGESYFDHTSFRSIYLSKDSLYSRDYRPPVTAMLEADRLVLAEFGTDATLEEIAEQLQNRYPSLFASREQASRHVFGLLERYQ